MILQVPHPRITSLSGKTYESVRGALSDLFQIEEESLYMYWRDIPIRIRYQQDLPRCFDKFLALVWMVQERNQGETVIEFLNQLLAIRWEVRWGADRMSVKGIFHPRYDMYSEYADALNKRALLNISKTGFFGEWKAFTHQLVRSLCEASVSIDDGLERRKWELLQSLDQKICVYGEMYRESI